MVYFRLDFWLWQRFLFFGGFALCGDGLIGLVLCIWYWQIYPDTEMRIFFYIELVKREKFYFRAEESRNYDGIRFKEIDWLLRYNYESIWFVILLLFSIGLQLEFLWINWQNWNVYKLRCFLLRLACSVDSLEVFLLLNSMVWGRSIEYSLTFNAIYAPGH